MEQDLAGKVALVTGGSRGIGRAAAQQLATRGATLAVHYQRRRDAAEETLASLAGSGHTAFAADLARDEDVATLVLRSWRASAGSTSWSTTRGSTSRTHPPPPPARSGAPPGSAHCRFACSLPPTSATRRCRRCASAAAAASSTSPRAAPSAAEPDAPAYGAAKAGLNAMSQSLAKALAPHGIFVFVVAPGPGGKNRTITSTGRPRACTSTRKARWGWPGRTSHCSSCRPGTRSTTGRRQRPMVVVSEDASSDSAKAAGTPGGARKRKTPSPSSSDGAFRGSVLLRIDDHPRTGLDSGLDLHGPRATHRQQRLRLRPPGLQPRNRVLQSQLHRPEAATSSAKNRPRKPPTSPLPHPNLQIDIVPKKASR